MFSSESLFRVPGRLKAGLHTFSRGVRMESRLQPVGTSVISSALDFFIFIVFTDT